MTNEERQLIAQFVARVGGNAPGGFTRSVPTTAPSLPPIDPEADRFIAEQFQSHPEARYRITQMAVVQEAALAEAANRIQQLQAALEQAQQQARQAQQDAAQPQSRGFLGGLFGGGSSAPPPQQQSPWNQGAPQQQQYAPPPQYPPNMQAGMFQQGGSGTGFLGSALRTAAGVAGGVVAGNVLMDLFSGHSGGGLFGGGGGFGGGFGGGVLPQETIITNNYGNAPGQQDPGGGWDNNVQSQTPDSDWSDNSQAPDDGGWDDNSGGGGWDDNSNA